MPSGSPCAPSAQPGLSFCISVWGAALSSPRPAAWGEGRMVSRPETGGCPDPWKPQEMELRVLRSGKGSGGESEAARGTPRASQPRGWGRGPEPRKGTAFVCAPPGEATGPSLPGLCCVRAEFSSSQAALGNPTVPVNLQPHHLLSPSWSCHLLHKALFPLGVSASQASQHPRHLSPGQVPANQCREEGFLPSHNILFV